MVAVLGLESHADLARPRDRHRAREGQPAREAHLAFTRINIELTFLKNQIEELMNDGTPRTRPPLLGKRPKRVFHSYHKASLSTECYLCCRLTLLPILPVAQPDSTVPT